MACGTTLSSVVNISGNVGLRNSREEKKRKKPHTTEFIHDRTLYETPAELTD